MAVETGVRVRVFMCFVLLFVGGGDVVRMPPPVFVFVSRYDDVTFGSGALV